jgi:hypothetical protein
VEPIIQFLDDVLVIAHWNNLQILENGGMLLSQHVRAMKAKAEMMHKWYPDMIVTLSITRPGVPIASKTVRDEMAQMLRDLKPIEQRLAVVLEATGIFASALRTTLKTMVVLTGQRNLKIVSSIGEGLDSLAPAVRTREGVTVSRAELEACVDKVRAAYARERTRPTQTVV